MSVGDIGKNYCERIEVATGLDCRLNFCEEKVRTPVDVGKDILFDWNTHESGSRPLNYCPLVNSTVGGHSSAHEPRQFEFHPTERIMVVGTVDNEVVIVDWEANETVDCAMGPKGDDSQVLALCWENGITSGCRQSRVFAGTNQGNVALYNYDFYEKKLELQHDFGNKYEKLTSVHVNSDNRYLAISGYEKDIKVFDTATAEPVVTFNNVHDKHINICRFANHFPNMLLSCSFDKTCKMWDMRVGPKSPVFTMSSERGFVMVTFSPSDLYFLASAVDNKVTQFRSLDGSLHTTIDLPQMGSMANYTRAYYMPQSRDIVVGSADESVVRICSSVTGKVTWESQIYSESSYRHFHIQSLRCNPIEKDRLSLILYHRYLDEGFKIVDVDLRRTPDQEQKNGNVDGSAANQTALAGLAFDLFREGHCQNSEMDVELICNDGKIIRTHSEIMACRWKWFCSHQGIRDLLLNLKKTSLKIQLPLNSCQILIDYLYSGTVGDLDNFELDDLFHLMHFAHQKELNLERFFYLLIKTLMEKIVNVYNVSECLKFASQYNITQAKVLLEDYCAAYFHFFSSLPNIQDLLYGSYKRIHNLYKQSIRPNFYIKSGKEILTHMRGRIYHNCVMVGNYAYCIGGFNEDGPRDLSHVAVLDTTTYTWGIVPTNTVVEKYYIEEGQIVKTVEAHLPLHLIYVKAVVVDEKIVLFGSNTTEEFNLMYILDPKQMKFKIIVPTPSPPLRQGFGITASKNFLWMYGGKRHSEFEYLDDLWKFDVRSYSWHRVEYRGISPSRRAFSFLKFAPQNRRLLVGLGHVVNRNGNLLKNLFECHEEQLEFSARDCFSDDGGNMTISTMTWIVNTLDQGGNDVELLILAGGFDLRRNPSPLSEITVVDITNNYEVTKMECTNDLEEYSFLRIFNCATLVINNDPRGKLIGIYGGKLENSDFSNSLLLCDVVSAWREGKKFKWWHQDMFAAGLTPKKAITGPPCTYPEDLSELWKSRDNRKGLRDFKYPSHDTDLIFLNDNKLISNLGTKIEEDGHLCTLDEEEKDEILCGLDDDEDMFDINKCSKLSQLVKIHAHQPDGQSEQFLVSRCILRSRSNMFSKMFMSSMLDGRASTLYLEVDVDAFKILLRYMYTGFIDLDSERDPFSILQLADRLRIGGLLDFMQTECLRFITCENVVDFIMFAQTCQLASLANAALFFTIVNFKEVSEHPSFDRLPADLVSNLTFLANHMSSVTGDSSNKLKFLQ